MDVMMQRWGRGDAITWTYVNPDFPDLVDQRPVRVIADADDHLAVWLAPGTRMLCQVTSDGKDLRTLPGGLRFTAPRAQALRRWSGAGIVAVFRPGFDYSVWMFETEHGLRNAYYLNIEAPFRRHDTGITTSDLILDVVVSPQRRVSFKDEDELEFARTSGALTEAQIAHIRHAGDDAARAARNWKFPFGSDYERFTPDSDWSVPLLPPSASWQFEL